MASSPEVLEARESAARRRNRRPKRRSRPSGWRLLKRPFTVGDHAGDRREGSGLGCRLQRWTPGWTCRWDPSASCSRMGRGDDGPPWRKGLVTSVLPGCVPGHHGGSLRAMAVPFTRFDLPDDTLEQAPARGRVDRARTQRPRPPRADRDQNPPSTTTSGTRASCWVRWPRPLWHRMRRLRYRGPVTTGGTGSSRTRVASVVRC